MDTYHWELRFDGTTSEAGHVRAPSEEEATTLAKKASGWDEIGAVPGSTWHLVVQLKGHDAGAGNYVAYESLVLSR